MKDKTEVESQIASLESMVIELNKQLPVYRYAFPKKTIPSNRVESCKLVRRLLGVHSRLQRARKIAIEFQDIAETTMSTLNRQTRINSIYDMRYRGAVKVVKFSKLSANNVDVISLKKLEGLITRFAETMAAIEPIAVDFEAYTLWLKSEYRAWKKVACRGMSEVVSGLLAWSTSKPNGKVPSHNYILSSCRNTEPMGLEKAHIYAIAAKKVFSPNYTAGEDFIRKAKYNLENDKPSPTSLTRMARYSRLCGIVNRMFPMLNCHSRTSLQFIPHYDTFHAVACRWASKKLDFHGVETYLLSKPEEIRVTERGERIYSIRATWLQRGTVNYRETLTLVSGLVYFVVFGGESHDTKYSVYHASAGVTIDTIVSQLALREKQRLERLERDRVAKLSERQKLARIARHCRSIDIVSFEDSLSVGNCRAGTMAFMGAVKLDSNVTQISGRLLARLWAKNGYPQRILFGNVVEAKQASN